MSRPVANLSGVYELQYNPFQAAFLTALDLCSCGRTDGICEGHQHAYNRLAIFAGRRGGKTKIGGVAAVKKALARKCYGWVCAPTFGDLNDFVMPAFFAAMPDAEIAGWSARFYELTLKNGSIVCFRSLDNPDDARGPGLDWAWIDETCKCAKVAWNTMMPALIDKKGIAWFTTTPRGFDWCYKAFWKKAQEGVPGFWAVQYRTIDNPIIDKALVEEQRAQMDPAFFQQEYEANFVNFQGAIYDIESQVLVTDDMIRAILPEWPKIDPSRDCIVGMDPGADHPFAGLLILKTSRGLVCIGEYLKRNATIAEHVRGLQRLCAQDNPGAPLTPTYAIDRSQKQTSLELSTYGIYPIGAENNVVNGIRRVQSWLSARQLWFVESRVPQTIEKMRMYRWADNASVEGEWKVKEAVYKEDDDLPDALRYALMTWPEMPELSAPVAITPRMEAFDDKTRLDVERIARINRRERNGGVDEDEEAGVSMEDPIGDFWNATETPRGMFLEEE